MPANKYGPTVFERRRISCHGHGFLARAGLRASCREKRSKRQHSAAQARAAQRRIPGFHPSHRSNFQVHSSYRCNACATHPEPPSGQRISRLISVRRAPCGHCSRGRDNGDGAYSSAQCNQPQPMKLLVGRCRCSSDFSMRPSRPLRHLRAPCLRHRRARSAHRGIRGHARCRM